MKPLPHLYTARLSGGDQAYAMAAATGVAELRLAPPLDFDGPGDAWSPEQLLIAAVGSCLLFTFRAVAQASKLKYTLLEVSVKGTVDRLDSATRFTEIILSPRLTLPAGSDHARALRLLEKSEHNCLISASLATPVRLEPEIVVG